MAEFVLWNPWLTGDCDTALYANLDETETRAFCVGTGTTTTLSPSTAVTGFASKTTTSEGAPAGVVTEGPFSSITATATAISSIAPT
jgi:hypothetical protein